MQYAIHADVLVKEFRVNQGAKTCWFLLIFAIKPYFEVSIQSTVQTTANYRLFSALELFMNSD